MNLQYNIGGNMQNFWHNNIPCGYSNHICFNQILFKKCFAKKHSAQNIREMKQRWDNLKRSERRQLQKKMKQTQRPCTSGINCYYLIKGNCRNGHSQFDLQLALNIRKQLLKTPCPILNRCSREHCYYGHENNNGKATLNVS